MRVRGRTERVIDADENSWGADRSTGPWHRNRVHFDHAFLPSRSAAQYQYTCLQALHTPADQALFEANKLHNAGRPEPQPRDRCACRAEADADAPEHCRQWDAIVCTTTHDPRPVRRGSTRIERHVCSYCCCRQWELVALAAGRSASTVSRDAACFGGWRICDGWLRQQRATCREAVQSQSH